MSRAAGPDSALVVIPARLAATRLPGKPLADINGLPMIERVRRRAVEANVGPVAVACGDEAIADAVRAHGGVAVLTDPDLPSGTDRARAALDRLDPERRFERVINLQGDFPTLDPAAVKRALAPLEQGYDMGTLAAEIVDEEEREDPAVVKAVVTWGESAEGANTRVGNAGARVGRALYFTRCSAPYGEGPLYHHVGIYAFERAALERFCALPPSPLERREKLEQLRALENGMSIGVALIDDAPFGVDTPAHLDKARRLLGTAR